MKEKSRSRDSQLFSQPASHRPLSTESARAASLPSARGSAVLVLRLVTARRVLATHAALIRRLLRVALITTGMPTLPLGFRGLLPILVHPVFGLLPRLPTALLSLGHVLAGALASFLARITLVSPDMIALGSAIVLIVSLDILPAL